MSRIGAAARASARRCTRSTLGGLARVMRNGPVLLIVSDGWDRGDPELLAREMARVRRSCRRVIWLNPLLGSANYEPLTRGMQAALPHVDDFLPVHNIASLEQLASVLASPDGPDRDLSLRGPPQEVWDLLMDTDVHRQLPARVSRVCARAVLTSTTSSSWLVLPPCPGPSTRPSRSRTSSRRTPTSFASTRMVVPASSAAKRSSLSSVRTTAPTSTWPPAPTSAARLRGSASGSSKASRG